MSYDPHDPHTFREVPDYEQMAALQESDREKFDSMFSGLDRIGLGHYLTQKERHREWQARR